MWIVVSVACPVRGQSRSVDGQSSPADELLLQSIDFHWHSAELVSIGGEERTGFVKFLLHRDPREEILLRISVLTLHSPLTDSLKSPESESEPSFNKYSR